MIRFENEVRIGRSAGDVFAYLADFENVPRWNYAITETTKLSDGPVGVGTAYRQRRSIPMPSKEDFEVTAFEPPSHLAIRGTIGPFPSELEYDLRAEDGETVVVNQVRLRPRGPMALAGKLATGRLRKAVAENLGVLKEVLEGRRRAT